MSVPVTLLFVQNVYIGEGWVLCSPCPGKGSEQPRKMRLGRPCARAKQRKATHVLENQVPLPPTLPRKLAQPRKL